MKKISIVFFILCIIGCAGTKGKKRTVKKSQHKSEISAYSQHWNIGEDSLNLFLHMRLPLKQFVFKKNSDHFYSNITYTLVISYTEKNVQVYRESWNEKVIQSYYEDTRNPDNYFTTEKNITLIPGRYKLFLNVQDEDSRQNWKLNEEYELKRVGVLGPALLFLNNAESQKTFAVNIMEKIDTLWIRTQVNLQTERVIRTIGEGDDEFEIDSDIQYTIIYNESIIDSGEIEISYVGIQNLYYLPIPFSQHKRGRYEIELSFLEDKQTTSFSYGYKTKDYWTDDVQEVVGVMRYILLYSEYKKLKGKDDLEKWNTINKYWKEKDPTPETPENELLIELNERVRFSNKNFSILMHGWRSDRGRIYIIYGEPHIVDVSYQDNRDYHYQKWVYSNGKEFIFIDRTMSGEFTLHQERF